MVYSIPERKFILETYLKTKSYKKVRELFAEKFNKNGPLKQYIGKLFSNKLQKNCKFQKANCFFQTLVI